MKYDIHHPCGHTQTYNLGGTNVNGERDQKRDFLESVPCMACERSLRSRTKTEILKQNYPALPEITEGTQKQIDWAESIRLEAAQTLSGLVDVIIDQTAPVNPELAEIGLGIIQETLWTTDYQFWIDSRYQEYNADWLNQQLQKGQEKTRGAA